MSHLKIAYIYIAIITVNRVGTQSIQAGYNFKMQHKVSN